MQEAGAERLDLGWGEADCGGVEGGREAEEGLGFVDDEVGEVGVVAVRGEVAGEEGLLGKRERVVEEVLRVDGVGGADEIGGVGECVGEQDRARGLAGGPRATMAPTAPGADQWSTPRRR